MIIGQVNYHIEAVIPVEVARSGGQKRSLDAVIDTGFSGYLSLNLATITTLQLPFIETRTYSLGDNTPVDFDLYGAVVLWHGQEKTVLVLCSEAHPLVGMSLLKGNLLTIEAADGGAVRIDTIP